MTDNSTPSFKVFKLFKCVAALWFVEELEECQTAEDVHKGSFLTAIVIKEHLPSIAAPAATS